MRDILAAILSVFRKGGHSLFLLALVLFFSSSPKSIYFLILFAVSQIPFLIRCNNVAHIIPMLLFSLTYCLFWAVSGTVSSYAVLFAILICPTMFYLFGEFLGAKLNYTKELPVALLILISSMLFVVFLTTISNIYRVGFVSVDRQLIFEDQANHSNATVWGLLVSPALGFLAMPFLINKRANRILPVSYAILTILALLTVIHVVNRGGLLIALVAMFISLYVKFHKKNKIVFILGSVLITLIVVYLVSLEGSVIDAYSARMDIESDGERFVRWLYGIKCLFTQPLGWNDVSTGHVYYMHNLWLDVARVSGIIPFFFLMIPTLVSLKGVFTLYKHSNSGTTIILISLYVTTFLSCFMEPALEAKPVVVFWFIFVWGVISGVLKNNSFWNECQVCK